MVGHDKLTSEGKKFFKEIEELAKLELRVGFQRGEKDDNGADIADVAMWNELGTVNMPPRPFLRQSVDTNETTIKTMCQSQLKAIASGKRTAQEALQIIGDLQKSLIQNTILNGEFESNADATVKKKKSDRPLIDTGRMRQSVNFVIQAKGGSS